MVITHICYRFIHTNTYVPDTEAWTTRVVYQFVETFTHVTLQAHIFSLNIVFLLSLISGRDMCCRYTYYGAIFKNRTLPAFLSHHSQRVSKTYWRKRMIRGRKRFQYVSILISLMFFIRFGVYGIIEENLVSRYKINKCAHNAYKTFPIPTSYNSQAALYFTI